MTGSEIVFENLKHDFPHRIIYRKTADGVAARVEGTMNGKRQGFDLALQEVSVRLAPAPQSGAARGVGVGPQPRRIGHFS